VVFLQRRVGKRRKEGRGEESSLSIPSVAGVNTVWPIPSFEERKTRGRGGGKGTARVFRARGAKKGGIIYYSLRF